MPSDPLAGHRPRSWRTTFDQAAEDYDAARPTYPSELIGEIVSLASLPSPAEVLEIGCGTGQATRPFAERGDRLTCLDIGAEMIAIARRKFAGFENVEFQQVAFEEWPAPSERFDLVLSATAFHWIDPEVGYPKAAKALKPTGALALIANEHQSFTPEFAADLYEIDRRLVPEWPDPRNLPDPGPMIERNAAEIDETGLFQPAIVRTFPWTARYNSADYLRLLNSYSNYRNLETPLRRELLAAIGELIDRRHCGFVSKSYLAVLYLARKKPE